MPQDHADYPEALAAKRQVAFVHRGYQEMRYQQRPADTPFLVWLAIVASGWGAIVVIGAILFVLAGLRASL